MLWRKYGGVRERCADLNPFRPGSTRLLLPASGPDIRWNIHKRKQAHPGNPIRKLYFYNRNVFILWRGGVFLAGYAHVRCHWPDQTLFAYYPNHREWPVGCTIADRKGAIIMQMTTLGRTNLTVSVAGLGCGGHSRLGLGTGGGERQAISIVHAAMDQGVNFIDTAQVYGTEDVVGRAVDGNRDQVMLSTKVQIVKPGAKPTGEDYISADVFVANFDDSLKRLRTDYVDIAHLHGVTPSQYGYCMKELVPALFRLREQGKIRFLGLTERFITDPRHDMLTGALGDDCWDVIMAGFNLINPSARERVFGQTHEKNIGVLNMFAVRRALSNADALDEIITGLIRDGVIDGGKLDADDPLGFLVHDGGAASIVEAAYRFCRHQSGTDIILTGTGNRNHLEENLSSLQKPPLAEACLQRLEDLFGAVDCISGN